jgi:putative PIN family toxin of toxin-antitoxin system
VLPRVLVDANLFVSHLLHPREPDRTTYQIVRAVLERRMTHVLVIELLQELEKAVADSAYLNQRITVEDVQRLRASLMDVSEIVTLIGTPIIPVLRDPRDDYLLTASWKFSIDILVTGDRDLLDARERIGPPRILTAAEYLYRDYP